MRVLWFANTPSLASTYLKESTSLGGWIASLEKQISKVKDIELGVAFPYGYDAPQSFSLNNTSYYSFPYMKDKGKITGFLSRWRHEIEPEDEVSQYLKIIDHFKPDIIHIFGSERSFGLINNEVKIPVILQIQGNLTVYMGKWYSGIPLLNTLYYASKKDVILGYGLFHEYYLAKKRAVREQRIMKKCRFIIGRTDWDRRISLILAPESSYFHCDEVLRDQFYHNYWAPINNSKSIIFSTLSPMTYKGLETILKAANLLKSTGKTDFEWQVAGIRGKEEIVKIIEKDAKLKFAENNVVFKGSLNPDELVTGMLNSKCYVHPSHIENSPNSVCEAMIMGVPVIATYTGGTSSLLVNGEEGILVQDGDPYVMAGALSELLNNPEKMRKFSENARIRASARHNRDIILKSVTTIYRKLLNPVL